MLLPIESVTFWVSLFRKFLYTHDVKDDVKFAINCYWDDTQGEGNHTHFVSGYTQTTGQSKESVSYTHLTLPTTERV